jgi:hypothetical protein
MIGETVIEGLILAALIFNFREIRKMNGCVKNIKAKCPLFKKGGP